MAGTSGLTRRERGMRSAALAWYRSQALALPWRGSDPWGVLVSEVMLQQTQVGRVVPAWEAFLGAFPTPAALASVAPAEAVRAWRGLGYNRRAVRLHAAATVVARDHGGVVPGEVEALRALPGVGGYAARAVAAFAFGRREAPVDTNVARVLARAVAGAPLGHAAAQQLADRLVPATAAADWGQALMDLGRQTCTARAARCDTCPLRTRCAWGRAGGPDPAAAGAHRPQGAFDGSARQRRGRMVDALRDGALDADALEGLGPLAQGTAAALVADGLATWDGTVLRLP